MVSEMENMNKTYFQLELSGSEEKFQILQKCINRQFIQCQWHSWERCYELRISIISGDVGIGFQKKKCLI